VVGHAVALLAGAFAFIAFAAGCGAGDGQPAGQPGASRIAFSFGGRIHVMSPDGSGRMRLTGGRFGREYGDLAPAWSPDGRTLAFVRTVYQRRSGDVSAGIYLIDGAGGRPRRLPVAGQLYEPAWAPDGRRVAFVRWTPRGERVEIEIAVTALDGSGEQVIHRERPAEDDVVIVTDVAWSPDGAQLAFTRTTLDERRYFRPNVYVVGLDGGDARVLASAAAAPAWSPDGGRIAFASTRDRNGRECYEQCRYKSELYVMDADGSNPVRLTRNRGEDTAPRWSPDGQRIVFQSDRNAPRAEEAELYSIAPDGSCLTWLTNGSPASVEPDWSVGSGSPARCGARPGPAIVEVDTRSVGRHRGEPAYWLGKRYGGRLLGEARGARGRRSRHSYYFLYDDCGRYRESACAPVLQMQEVSVCARAGSSTLTVLDQPEYGPRVRAWAAHGLLFVDIGQQDVSAIIGARHVRLLPGVGGRHGRRLAIRALLNLREFGRGRRRPLPAPALPRDLLERLRRTEAGLARVPERQARRRLELLRAVEALPSVRAVDCG
jgi:Tol biopolymer transport system component